MRREARALGCVLLLGLLLAPEGWAQRTRETEQDAPTTPRGTENACRYAGDGECDEPSIGTGACRPGSDTNDCTRQNSCAHAHDGVCDQPGPYEGNTALCDHGTDSDDCCPEHAHAVPPRNGAQAVCACNANYVVDAATQTCRLGSRPSSPSISARCQQCNAECADLEDDEAIQLCHDDCEYQACSSNSWLVSLVVLVFLIGILFFPCIVFGFAHVCCIRDQRKDGRQPVPHAWTICSSLFVTALLCTWFPYISILWLVLPFCMVAPFCMDRCYEDIGEGTPAYGGRAEARARAQREAARREAARGDVVTTAAVTVQAVPVQATPVMAQAIIAQPMQPVEAEPSPARTHNPLSLRPVSIAPGAAASPVVASALPAGDSAEFGMAATFEVEDDFDDPDDGISLASTTHAAPGGASPHQQSNLTRFLVANELEKFEGELRALGAVDVPDLRELEEEDMLGVGMKILEIRRMHRGLAAANPSDV